MKYNMWKIFYYITITTTILADYLEKQPQKHQNYSDIINLVVSNLSFKEKSKYDK